MCQSLEVVILLLCLHAIATIDKAAELMDGTCHMTGKTAACRSDGQSVMLWHNSCACLAPKAQPAWLPTPRKTPNAEAAETPCSSSSQLSL